jgi:predicted ribosome quality control (RQC) complex YloA/Tae2 family protein
MNIKDYESELDVIIEKLTKRVKWYLSKLETLEDDIQASNKTSDALNKIASLLLKYLEVKGYKF